MYRLCAYGISFAALLATEASAQFPSWDADQTAVWSFIERSWADEVAENDRWPASYVHDKVIDWGDRQPAPRGLDRLVEWTRFDYAGSDILYYEITPAAIVVEDDTAVVHYHLMIVSEDAQAERDSSVLGLVEVLIRQNREWKFLSLSGFEPKLNDD